MLPSYGLVEGEDDLVRLIHTNSFMCSVCYTNLMIPF